MFFLVAVLGIAGGYVFVQRSFAALRQLEQKSIGESLGIPELQEQLKEAEIMRMPEFPSMEDTQQ